MRIRFPQQHENIRSGRCAECNLITLLRWHFGPLQTRKLCDGCGDKEWRKLLAETGRLAEWDTMIA